MVELLDKLEELVRVVQRRGIDFADFLGQARRRSGRLPLYRVVVDGEEHFFHTADDRDAFLKRAQAHRRGRGDGRVRSSRRGSRRPATAGADAPTATATATASATRQARHAALQKNQELHEVKDLEKLFTQLEQYGLSIDDYFLTQEESVSGEKLATKYALVHEDHTHDVAGVAPDPPRDPQARQAAAWRSSASRAWAR